MNHRFYCIKIICHQKSTNGASLISMLYGVLIISGRIALILQNPSFVTTFFRNFVAQSSSNIQSIYEKANDNYHCVPAGRHGHSPEPSFVVQPACQTLAGGTAHRQLPPGGHGLWRYRHRGNPAERRDLLERLAPQQQLQGVAGAVA